MPMDKGQEEKKGSGGGRVGGSSLTVGGLQGSDQRSPASKKEQTSGDRDANADVWQRLGKDGTHIFNTDLKAEKIRFTKYSSWASSKA